MSQIEFSVVIVSYNNLEIVVDCLDSIYKFNDIGERLEIILVDNSPEDNIYNYCKEKYKEITVIKNTNNGFGEGNNRGASISTGKYLLFLNPDTQLIEPIFQFSIEQFEKNDDLGLFGLKLIDINFKNNMSYFFLDRHGFINGQIIKMLNFLNIYLDGEMFISGANIFIRKELFIQCGMFDENIFMYYEEPDITKRVRLLNKKTDYFKVKRIIHLEGKTSNDSTAALIRRLKSAEYYNKKYNLNFSRQLKSEISYNKLKLILYKMIDKTKSENCKRNIEIIGEFLNV